MQMQLTKRLCFLLLFLVLASFVEAHTFKILVFSKTAGFRHQSIPDGISAIQQLGLNNDFEVDVSEDASQFVLENLQNYSAVVFLSTTGDILNSEQQLAFEQYIVQGGGFVGIHAASDTEYDWPWYNGLVGTYFDSHPSIQTATIKVADKVHPSTSFLGDYWQRTDEWYDFQDNPRGKVHVLATLDESTYSGGGMGHDHPIAWCHQYEGGRSWYTGGGHTSESFEESDFLNHILGGIKYAAGDIIGDFDATVSAKYLVTVVDENPSNPMVITVLPDLSVLYVERGGTVKYKNIETGLVQEAGTLDVDAGREDGLLGIAVDPDFENNNWIYLFYSPNNVVEQLVSRFEFVDGTVDMSSEAILLRIPTQRDECCHSGGDLEFDGEGNLFISTGDNVNPFASNGYAPIDERGGRSAWDAQGTSANTNDLRGKILRIHPEDDGTYTVPSGNLFTSASQGKEEIYAMGLRNPFRIAVNKKNSELSWGDVGPDAGGNSSSRGPRGHDEYNRTSVSGNFGWPYFVADNQAYIDYNFDTGASGSAFNPNSPVNNSPNNTGAQTLPAAIPAWIYYNGGEMDEFPEIGSASGRTAIAGGYYHLNEDNVDNGGFPEYYDNSLFIMEWSRNWIKEVRFDADGNLMQINPFLEDLALSRPIDMHFGPDGAMYVIEWGTGFGGDNPDAQIIKIQYLSVFNNFPPVASLEASAVNGSAPFQVVFSATNSSDLDPGDILSFSWDFDGDGNEDSNEISPTYTFTENGVHLVKLTVTDLEGATDVDQIEIVVGNSAPVVTIDFPVEGGFYFDNETISYQVSVSDEEEGISGLDVCNEVTVEPSIGHDDHAHGAGPSQGCEGDFLAESHGDGPDNVFYVLNASYEDDGGNANYPITGTGLAILQPKLKQAEHYQEFNNIQAESTSDFLGGGQNIGYIKNGSYLMYSPMNFSNIDFLTVRSATRSDVCWLEVRIDAPDGELIAKRKLPVTGGWQDYDFFTTAITNPGGTHDVYFVFTNPGNSNYFTNVNWFEFHGKGVSQADFQEDNGLSASYFNNSTFSGTPVTRKEPMISWDWESGSPVEGIASDGFSVRWEGNIVAPSSAQYTISTEMTNGSVNVWIDDQNIIDGSGQGTASINLTEGQEYQLKVEYVHTSGESTAYLRWSAGNAANVIHASNLQPGEGISTVTATVNGAPQFIDSDSPFTVNVNFSSAVTGFDVDDIVVTNASLSNFMEISGDEYQVTITPASFDDVTINIPASVALDSEMVPNTSSGVTTIVYSYQLATTITGFPASIASDTSFSISITFSAEVTGFDISDIQILGASLSEFMQVSGSEYQVTVTATGFDDIIIIVPSSVALDSLARPNDTSPVITIDNKQNPPLAVSDKQGLSVFPNPTNDILYIHSEKENIEYELFNLTGMRLSSGFYNNGISLKELPKGIYFLNLEGTVFRVIKSDKL